MVNSWDAMKADTIRQYGRFSLGLLLKGAATRRTFRPIVTMRLCQAARDARGALRWTLPLCKVAHKMATQMAAMDFSWDTSVGAGFALTHGWGLVVSPGATIGGNVTLFHGATLGRRDRIARDGSREIGYPTLEDEVWVGAHAIIVGAITIGRGSRIAAGAFVTQDIPPYSIVSGNPSSIVKSNCRPDVMNPAPLPGQTPPG
ncbi:serine O-acetyltransferase [Oxalobacteraceae bacterium GrIS 1.11]